MKHKYALRLKNNKRYYVNTCLKKDKIRQLSAELPYHNTRKYGWINQLLMDALGENPCVQNLGC